MAPENIAFQLADPADCRHPLESLTVVTDRGTFDWRYQVCGQCLSEYLLCDDDCRGACPCDGVTPPPWRPVTDPEHVPAQALAELLTGRYDDELRDLLPARREAAGAGGPAELADPVDGEGSDLD